jgi:hypothetical protein
MISFLSKLSIEEAAIHLQLASYAPILPPGIQPADLHPHFARLCREQQAQLDAGQPVNRLPLIAVALANFAGLVVDPTTGQVVGWPVAGGVEVVRG